MQKNIFSNKTVLAVIILWVLVLGFFIYFSSKTVRCVVVEGEISLDPETGAASYISSGYTKCDTLLKVGLPATIWTLLLVVYLILAKKNKTK